MGVNWSRKARYRKIPNIDSFFIFFRNLLVGVSLVMALLDNGFYLVAEMILKTLTVTEFCSIFIVGKRPQYSLANFAESTLRTILYKNTSAFEYLTCTESNPRYSNYTDQQSLWCYQQPSSPQQAFSLDSLKVLSPLKLWQFYKTTVDLSKIQRESSKWLFDTYSRPSFGAKELSLSYNPRYPVYAVSHQDHSGYFQFSVHSHPSPIRNKQGQDLFYRSGEEYDNIRGGLCTVHWSPNGEYLAVFDRFHRTILTFFKYCPDKGTVRRIKNLSFSFGENVLLSNCQWLESSTFFLPDTSSESVLLKKLSLASNNTYSLTELEHSFWPLRESKLGFFGAVPDSNLLFYVTACSVPEHYHDHVFFSRVGPRKATLSRLTLSGIVTSYCTSKKCIFFMTRSHKRFSFTPAPHFFNFTNQAESYNQCPFSNFTYKLKTGSYSYKTKLFRFISVDVQTLAAEFLNAQLPHFEYKGDSSEGHTRPTVKTEQERLRKCSKRNRLTSTKFYLCFNTADRTFFISKFCKAVFSTYHGTHKLCHPSQPIFALSHSRLFRPTKLKFFLQTGASQELKSALPKSALTLDYNKPLLFKQTQV